MMNSVLNTNKMKYDEEEKAALEEEEKIYEEFISVIHLMYNDFEI